MRVVLTALIAVGLLGSAQAQSYPTHPVRVIVPTVAGGTVDVITRLVSNHLSATLGNTFFVDNRSGAGNTLGSNEAARATPDGYTLLMSSGSGQVISPLVYKNLDYDPVKSFVPIGLVAESAIILVANPSVPFKSVAELVAYAKANPGKLNYSSAGTGTVPHLTGELFKSGAGIDIVHVPYRGGAPATADVIAGNIHLTFDAAGPLLQHIRDGRLKALAVMSTARTADLPDVPTMAESGYPAVVSTSWTGLFAPAGTDAAVVTRLNIALNQGLQSPELQSALARLGNEPRSGPSGSLEKLLISEIAKWGPVVKTLNLKPE
jgi:tripartite-type tricarboxylate transporter receptor subunit TctC